MKGIKTCVHSSRFHVEFLGLENSVTDRIHLFLYVFLFIETGACA
jgi:hypothetical protein